MQAVILSAGQGKRLYPLTAEIPKCLIDFHGKTILDWQLDMLFAAGVSDVTIITGYRADRIAARMAGRPDRDRLHLLHNDKFNVSDNLYSAWLARHVLASGPSLLLNGDTLVSAGLTRQALAGAEADITVTVDFKRHYDDDDMKVQLREGRVAAVSKTLSPANTHAESIGMILFRGNGGKLFARQLEQMVAANDTVRLYYLAAVQKLAERGLVGASSIRGHLWAEVDFPADLEKARAITAGWRSQDKAWDSDAACRTAFQG